MEEGKKKSKKGKYILIGTGVGLLGLSAFAVWWFKFRNSGIDVSDPKNALLYKTKNKKEENTEGEAPEKNTPRQIIRTEKTTFPLRKGDKGMLVKNVQENLLEIYGADILPKHGADGDFGTELADALKSKGFPTVIDEVSYKKIISGGGTPENNSAASNTPTDTPQPNTPSHSPSKQKGLTMKQAIDVAKNIWLNATLKKLDGMTTQLKRMHSIHDYKMVNILFRTIRTNGEKQDVANAIVSAFSNDETSKQILTQQFERIGLKYDGEKWELAGIKRSQLITTQETTIRDNKGIGLDVPENTLLGEVVSEVGQVTTFRAINDQILYVPTKHISHV